jgi:hypothetical protein
MTTLPTTNEKMPMRRSKLSPEDFPTKQLVRQFEGGSVHTAKRRRKWYVIEDESSFLGLLNEEDQAGLEFVRVYEFDSDDERERYLRERGWWPVDK